MKYSGDVTKVLRPPFILTHPIVVFDKQNKLPKPEMEVLILCCLTKLNTFIVQNKESYQEVVSIHRNDKFHHVYEHILEKFQALLDIESFQGECIL